MIHDHEDVQFEVTRTPQGWRYYWTDLVGVQRGGAPKHTETHAISAARYAINAWLHRGDPTPGPSLSINPPSTRTASIVTADLDIATARRGYAWKQSNEAHCQAVFAKVQQRRAEAREAARKDRLRRERKREIDLCVKMDCQRILGGKEPMHLSRYLAPTRA